MVKCIEIMEQQAMEGMICKLAPMLEMSMLRYQLVHIKGMVLWTCLDL